MIGRQRRIGRARFSVTVAPLSSIKPVGFVEARAAQATSRMIRAR
jgi:hypothetical protein